MTGRGSGWIGTAKATKCKCLDCSYEAAKSGRCLGKVCPNCGTKLVRAK